MNQVDPKFQAWFKSRKVAQKLKLDIPTRNANPTRQAGPKNSNGKQSTGSPTKNKPLAKSANVARPKGKSRSHPTKKG